MGIPKCVGINLLGDQSYNISIRLGSGFHRGIGLEIYTGGFLFD
jgi:hypothetical protein